MSDTQTKTREQELLDEFAEGVDRDSVPELAKRIADLEAEADRSSDAAATMQRQRDEAVARAEKAEKSLKSAQSKVARGPAAARARKVGQMPKDAALSGAALTEVLADAAAEEKTVEIVFSDGARELTQVPPAIVTGNPWVDKGLGKFLGGDPIVIEGPAPGQPGFAIAGYALLIDGKQVAWSPRSDPLNVAPGSRVTLADDIYF